MSLTASQLSTLKTDIQGRASLASSVAAADWPTVAAFYNAPASPAVNVWRADIATEEIAPQVVMSDFVALTAVKQNGLLLLTQGPKIDATQANVRSAFASIFGAGSTTLTNLTALAQRPATRFEAMFLTAAGAANISRSRSARISRQASFRRSRRSA